jgi:hypothetical protein
MATKMTTKVIWTDYALLTPTKGGKPWKVQINAEGKFRCNCPSWIFCRGAVRTCKHIRRCEEQRATEGVAVPVARLDPWVEEATKATDVMMRAGRMFPDATQTASMVEALAARLRTFNGGAMVAEVAARPAAVVVGVRMITFDD